MKAGDQPPTDLLAYKTVLAAYFRAIDLLPVFVSADQAVGDVYDIYKRWAFLSSGRECFPDLAVSETPGDLPDTVELKRSEVSLAFGLSKLLQLGGAANRTASVKLKFTEVTVQRASQLALRRALCKACSSLRPIVNGEPTDYDPASLPIIVGTVLSAKREIFVGDVAGAEGRLVADATALAGLTGLEIVNLDASVSAAFGYGSTSGCLLRSRTAMPVAIGPAFYPALAFDRVQGLESTHERIDAVEWRAAENGPDRKWLNSAADTLPWPA